MSDPSSKKVALELEQVRRFLDGAGIPHVGVEPGGDPPDVVIRSDGSPPIAAEVTEYHRRDNHIADQMAWQRLQARIDALHEASPKLRSVSLHLSFQDLKVPEHARHGAIAEQVIRCAESVLRSGWDGKSELQAYFVDPGERPLENDDPGWMELDGSAWPTLARYVTELTLNPVPPELVGFPASSCFHAQSAFPSPTPDDLQMVLERKQDSIGKAIRTGRLVPGGGPLWLLIVTDTPGDISSFITGSSGLEEAIRGIRFDYAASHFDEIWMAQGCHPFRARRLHPSSDG